MQNEDQTSFCNIVNENWEEECIQKLTISGSPKRDNYVSNLTDSTLQTHRNLSRSEISIKEKTPLAVQNQSDSKSQPEYVSEYENNIFQSKTDELKENNENIGDICDALIQALENPRERLNILKFEKKIKKFMEDPTLQEYVFPPLTSYQRFAVHHLAQRFELHHTPMKIGNSENHGIHLLKTPSSTIPSKLLLDIVSQKSQEQQSTQEKVQPKLLTKQNTKNKTKKTQKLKSTAPQKQKTELNAQLCSESNLEQNNEANLKIKSVDERQKEYDDARARIFQESNLLSDIGSLNNPISNLDQEIFVVPTPFIGPESCSTGTSRSKAMRRDREAERSDPDFIRHTVPQRYPRAPMTATSGHLPMSTQFFPVYSMGNNYQFSNIPLHHQPNMSGFPYNQPQNQPTPQQSQPQQQQHYPPHFYASQPFHAPMQNFHPSQQQQQQQQQQYPRQYQQQMIHPNLMMGSGNRYEHQQISPSFSIQPQPGMQPRFRDHLDEDFPPLHKGLHK